MGYLVFLWFQNFKIDIFDSFFYDASYEKTTFTFFQNSCSNTTYWIPHIGF